MKFTTGLVWTPPLKFIPAWWNPLLRLCPANEPQHLSRSTPFNLGCYPMEGYPRQHTLPGDVHSPDGSQKVMCPTLQDEHF